ncbi:MAG TPA: methyltransferase domain-containing protein, partial [Steroidobacteraceae bacterium]|nr:methyltransferase domain-containing protein [Steroidobacteraceae bacterium]
MHRLLSTPLTTIALTLALVAPTPAQEVDPVIRAAIEHPDRPARDKKRDALRKPGEVLTFFGVQPGMSIIEYFAAGGFTAEILARAVGAGGKVYMQNPAWYYERAGQEAVDERLANVRLANVVRLDKPIDGLDLPDESVDGAIMNLVFHDFFWLTGDVSVVLQDLYRTLEPGGFVGVVDHAAPAGTGTEYAMDREGGQHRIDEATVRRMFLDAGFVLQKEGDFLRNPDDDRSQPFFAPDMRGKPTDRFVL